jgi:hypothetical protein
MIGLLTILLLYSEMKRILVIILSILYIASATGATVHIHYCMGKLISAGFINEEDDDNCKRCGMKKATQKKDCCKEEHKTLKMRDHQLAKAPFDFTYQFFISAHPTCFYYVETVYPTKINTLPHIHSRSTCWRKCPIYIQVQGFRI